MDPSATCNRLLRLETVARPLCRRSTAHAGSAPGNRPETGAQGERKRDDIA